MIINLTEKFKPKTYTVDATCSSFDIFCQMYISIDISHPDYSNVKQFLIYDKTEKQ